MLSDPQVPCAPSWWLKAPAGSLRGDYSTLGPCWYTKTLRPSHILLQWTSVGFEGSSHASTDAPSGQHSYIWSRIQSEAAEKVAATSVNAEQYSPNFAVRRYACCLQVRVPAPSHTGGVVWVGHLHTQVAFAAAGTSHRYAVTCLVRGSHGLVLAGVGEGVVVGWTRRPATFPAPSLRASGCTCELLHCMHFTHTGTLPVHSRSIFQFSFGSVFLG